MPDIITLPVPEFKAIIKTVLTEISANDSEFHSCRVISEAIAKRYDVDSEALIRRVSNLLSGEHRAEPADRIVTGLQRYRNERNYNASGGSYSYRIAL